MVLLSYYIRIVKPIWGFISDAFQIQTQRRRPYLIITSSFAFVLSLFIHFTNDLNINFVFGFIFLLQCAIVWCNIIAEALVVELSHDNASHNICLFFGLRAFGALCFTLFELEQQTNPFQILSFFPLGIFAISLTLHEQSIQPAKPLVLAKQVMHFLYQPFIYRPVLFVFFFMASPSPSTSMFYFYVNQLKLDDAFFATLRYTYSICSIMAIIIYYQFRTIRFNQMLQISNLLYIAASLSSLILVTRLNVAYLPDYQLCMMDNIIMQILQEINTLPVLVLACRMCPARIEATVYSILMATINLSNVISRETGILLTEYLGITSQDFSNLWLLIVLCNLISNIPIRFIGAVDEDRMSLLKSQTKEDLHKLL